jgi:hypothetical protein
MSLETEFHTELEVRCCEYVESLGYKPLVNVRLPNGRIADIIYIASHRQIEIIEVKTALKPSLVEEAVKKYLPYTNRLFIAGPAADYWFKAGWSEFCSSFPMRYRAGALAISERTVSMIRDAAFHPLSPIATDYLTWKLREVGMMKEEPRTNQPMPARP